MGPVIKDGKELSISDFVINEFGSTNFDDANGRGEKVSGFRKQKEFGAKKRIKP